jgi:hypothetical protein
MLIKICCICFPGAVSREIKEHFLLVSTREKYRDRELAWKEFEN